MSRHRYIVLVLSLFLLLLAHGIALIYRVQPAVSLWFPPSGIAIALTFWLGPVGIILTGIASILMAPFWGSDGWTRLVGLTDVTEPLIAWLLYCQCFRGSLSFRSLRDAIAFIISVPITACATSALFGSVALLALGKMPADTLGGSIGHWWLGNAIGIMAITPTVLLVFTPLLRQWGWLCFDENRRLDRERSRRTHRELHDFVMSEVDGAYEPHQSLSGPSFHLPIFKNKIEFLVIVALSLVTAWFTVRQSHGSPFALQNLSLLSFVPILWATIQFGTTGGMLVSTFGVLVTLLDYLLLHPQAFWLPYFPVDAQLLHIHKLSLLVQCGVSLLVGTAIAERTTIQVALAQEQVRSTDYQAQAQLSEQLFQLNHSLTEANQQLFESEERFRTSVETMLDCFGVYSAIRDQTGRILDFRIEYVNDAACIHNHMTREEQIGRGLCEILPRHRDSGLFDKYSQVVETGQPLIEDALVYEDYYGQRRLIRAFDIRVAKFGDGFVATWRDISDRKQTEAALRQKQEWLDLAQAAAKLGSFEWNIQTNLNTWSKELEALYGLKPGEFGGSYEEWARWVHPDDLAQAQADVLSSLKSGEFFTEFRVIWPDGSIHWLHARARVYYDDEGKPLRMVGVNADISDAHRQAELRKQAQEALRQSEDRLRKLAQSNIIGIVEVNLDQITFANDAFLNMVGYSYEDVLTGRMRWQDITPPEYSNIGQNALAEIVSSGICSPFEKEYIRKDGSRVPVLIGAALLEREPLNWVCFILDLSERKQAEKALRESKESLSLALDAARMGSWDWNVQTNEIIWTPYHEMILGYEPGTPKRSYQDWVNRVYPDDLPQVQAAIQTAMLEQRDYKDEYRVIWPDGSVHWVSSFGRFQYDAAGEPIRMLGMLFEISDRKQVEAALLQSELIFRTLADTMPQMFWVTQADGYHEYFNQRWYDYTGTTLEQTRGEGWQTILHPDDVQRTIECWQTSLHTGKTYEIEYRLRCASDGEYRWHLARALPLRNQEGQIVNWFGSCTDIHDQKLAIEERAQALERERAARIELERASRMKDEFLAIVSHELRSPLNGILGWSRLLRTRKLDSQKTEQALASIERNAQAQTQLIEDLLDISRIIRGTVRLNLCPTHLIPVIEAALDTVRPMASTKSIQIESQLNFNGGLVSGDPDRLQQIVWNLLSNAVKFTPQGGRVEIRLQQANAYAQLQVIDTGKGISPEFLPRVFDRFRQADATTTRTQGGLGLGLAIVRNLVELHGGRIYAESQGEGQGTTFTVELPLLSNDSDSSEPENLSLARQTAWETTLNLSGMKILAVDDEADAREFMKTALEQYGAVVTTAASAHEALELLPVVKPDVLLSDIGMPVEDGYTLMRRMRSLPAEQGGQTPAAALTAYAREDDRIQALAAGFQMHVPKPIEPLQLLTVITKLARRSDDDP